MLTTGNLSAIPQIATLVPLPGPTELEKEEMHI